MILKILNNFKKTNKKIKELQKRKGKIEYNIDEISVLLGVESRSKINSEIMVGFMSHKVPKVLDFYRQEVTE